MFPYQFLCTARNKVNNKTKNLGEIKEINSVSSRKAKKLKIQKPV